MANCAGIQISADFNCDFPLQPGVRNGIYLGNVSDIQSVAYNGEVITGITLKENTFTYFFDGVRQSVIPQYTTVEPYGFSHEVQFSVYDISPAQKQNIERLAYKPVFAIVEGMQGQGQGNTFFEVYGIDRGMYANSITRNPSDAESASAFIVTISTMEEGAKENKMPATFFDTDYNTTEEKIIELATGSGGSPEVQAMLLNYASLGAPLLEPAKTAMSDYVTAEVAAGNHALKDFEAIITDTIGSPNTLVDYKGGKVMTNLGATINSEGALFSGTEYINTNYTPSTDAINYATNDALASVYLKTSTLGEGVLFYFIGNNDTNNRLWFGNSSTIGQISMMINTSANAGAAGDASTSGDILMTITRDAGANTVVYKNGVIEGSPTFAASSSIPTSSVLIGARNDILTAPFSGIISSVVLGAAVGFDHAAHNTNLRALLTTLGAI